jgi:hypothetical protein
MFTVVGNFVARQIWKKNKIVQARRLPNAENLNLTNESEVTALEKIDGTGKQ